MKKRFIILITAALCLALSFSIASYATAGTSDDPLISKSGLMTILAGYATKEDVSQSSSEYVVLEGLSAGKIVVGGASTEMILRSGKASAYVSSDASGGLSDLTAGSNLSSGKSISANHLVLVPRADGRGFKVTQDNTYIMVKGSYTIQ